MNKLEASTIVLTNPLKFRITKSLAGANPMTPSDLSAKNNILPIKTEKNLKELRYMGLVEIINPETQHHRLTPKGEAVAKYI